MISKNLIKTNFPSFNEKFECCNANYNKFYNFSVVLILLKTLLKSLILKKACRSRNCTCAVEVLHLAVQGSETSSRKSLIKLT